MKSHTTGRWTREAALAAPLAFAGCDVTWSLHWPEAGLFLESTVAAIMWTVANVVYYDQKRRGIHGVGRFAAFWIGNPATWITYFLVPEGSAGELEPPPDDEAALFAEVREFRKLHAGAADAREPDEGESPQDG